MVTPTQRQSALKWAVNTKKLSERTACRALGLSRSTFRRHKVKGTTTEAPAPEPNVCWSLDFMSNALTSRQALRWLNVIDDFSREALCTQVAFSFPARAVVRALETLIATAGKPSRIRSDNGPEFISARVHDLALSDARSSRRGVRNAG